MRRKNRIVSNRMSVMATNSMRFGAIIVFLFVMVVLNLLSSSSCKELLKERQKLERELARLEDVRVRESTRWEGMKTPEKLEQALVRHGISMRFPRPEQVVRMKADGTPRLGQLSLARAAANSGKVASVNSSSRQRNRRGVR